MTRSEQAPGVPQEGPGPGAGPAVGGGGRASPQPAPSLLTSRQQVPPASDAAPHLSPPGSASSPFPLLQELMGSAHRPLPPRRRPSRAAARSSTAGLSPGSGGSDLRGAPKRRAVERVPAPCGARFTSTAQGPAKSGVRFFCTPRGGRAAFQAQGPGVRNRPGKSADSQCSKF